MQNVRLILSIIFILSIMCFSCKKENVDPRDCTGSCKQVRLTGKVFDVSSNEGIKNVEVNAHFYQWKSTCFICFGVPVETFAKTTTDDLGTFNFDITVDADIFDGNHHYSLNVYANTSNSYISGNYASFDKCDRVEDYKIAWAHFEKIFEENKSITEGVKQ